VRFGSLFAGIGGFDLGLERAGMESAWQVEIHKYCTSVLERHWPGVKRYGDIKQIDPADLEPVDLICGGFPCQPASQAGKQLGIEDDRWLWPEFYRILRGLNPRWVMVENVPQLRAVNAGRAFGEVVGDLASLGYDTEWDCISAAHVGAPHIRDRVWIIGRDPNADSVQQAAQRSLGEGTEAHAAPGSADTHADSGRRKERRKPDRWASGPQLEASQRHDAGGLDQDVSHADRAGRVEQWRSKSVFAEQPELERTGWWETEPAVGRLVDGLPSRVERMRSLGNAVVPAVVEHLGRRIVAIDSLLPG
jgi:DNA (cytosine-5)-methyltransferase 1